MALYLKYRPQDFKSLVGQGFIKETLQKAVEQDKTVGAYLFTGPRGTGKTSTARIFAKAINCTNITKGNPCLTCDVCQDFADGKLIDIVEIDAASHTGVDNIREIIERAQFQPTKTKYKIYIIDEVHMLSKGAFNALLKILEEPPAHVKFILATTEIHKVPETILSRCQRYDFKNHTAEDTKERLKYIATQEKVTIDTESLDYIVTIANGGLRNAISLFEQLIVDNKITYDYITETLGVSKIEEVESFANKLVKRDASLMLELETLEKSGKNIQLFFRDVLHYLGNLAKTELLSGNDINTIISVLDILHDSYGKSKNSIDENLTFRIGVMKILGDYSPVSTPANNEGISQGGGTPPSPSEGQETKKDTLLGGSDGLVPSEKGQKTKDIPQENPVVEQETSLFSDAQDVFTSSEPAFGEEIKTKDAEKSGDFDKNIFIAEVKKTGAKGAVTMSLRGADFVLKGDILTIQCKTKMALTSLDTPEAKDYLSVGLTALGRTDISINIV